jgi:O-antigen/teichoic acid export membrane protein
VKGYLLGLLANYLGLALSIAIQIFLMPFLLSAMGRELTGLYYLFMTIANFVAVGVGWMTGAGVYLLASADSREDAADPGEVHWVVFLGYTVYAGAVMLVIWAWGAGAGRWWLAAGDPALVAQGRSACLFLGIYIWVNYIHQADVALFTALLAQGWANFYRIVSQAVFVVLVFGVVLAVPRLDLLMAANLCGALAAGVWARIHLRRSGRLAPWRWRRPPWDLVRQMFYRKGRDYFIFGLAQFGLIYGDVLMVGAILGPAKVSAYLIIWKIPEVMALILGRISEILSPYLTRLSARAGPAAVAALFLCTSRMQHGLAVISGSAYAFYGRDMSALWVGEGFRPETPWYYWIAGMLLFFQVVNRHDIVLHCALARLGRLVPVQFAELALKLLLTLLLFDRLDVAAPLVSGLVVQAAGATWMYRLSALKESCVGAAGWFRQVGAWWLLLAAAAPLLAWLCRRAAGGGTAVVLLSLAVYGLLAAVLFIGIEWQRKAKGMFHLYRSLSEV